MYKIEGLFYGEKIKIEVTSLNRIDTLFNGLNLRNYIDIDQESVTQEVITVIYPEAIKDISA